jgi:hypothetical protein
MASALAEAHIEAQARLRRIVASTVEQAWRRLPGYDRENLDEWTRTVVPMVMAGERASVNLTNAYLARALERQPLGINPDELIGSNLRDGIPPAEVYSRPFVTVWTALKEGKPYEDAVKAGLARAVGSVAIDIQMAMRSASDAIEQLDDGIYGYQRVADAGACTFCQTVDGAYVKSAAAMPLHNNCGCGLEPLTAPHRLASKLPSGVAVHQHGELGPVLTDPAHDFTTEALALG